MLLLMVDLMMRRVSMGVAVGPERLNENSPAAHFFSVTGRACLFPSSVLMISPKWSLVKK
jgi:hypothetical protein